MGKAVLIFALSLCLLATACTRDRAGASASAPPPEGAQSAVSIRDHSGADITGTVVKLWRDANQIYDVDDTELFAVDLGAPVQLFDDAPEYFALNGYDGVVDAVFTANGKAQLEQTKIGGPYALIQKRDGAVYRMGPWKTGVSFGGGLVSAAVLDVAENRIVLEMAYSVALSQGETLDGTADFTIAKEDGVWLVDDYVYPEAQG